MDTSPTFLKRLALSLTLALSAVVVLTAWLNAASARTATPALFNVANASVGAISDGLPDLCQRDLAILFDRSGSMGEDTRCYGCWEPAGEYPAGNTFPLPFEIDPDAGVAVHCLPSDPVEFGGYHYISIEAEHYTRFLTEADYHRDATGYPRTWWAMQRQPDRNASGPDARGAFMMVGPHSAGAMYYETLDDIQHPPAYTTTPRLDYDFTVPADGTYYVWIRAQGGSSATANEWINGRNSRRWVHVGLNGVPMNTGQTPEWGPYNDGANPDSWRWTRVLILTGLLATGPGDPYTLNVWQAGQGFRLDKIVIANDPRDDLVGYGRPLGWDSEAGVTDAGPAETHGRTGWACLEVDPRFTPVDPVYGRLDDLYDDYQPIRGAKEAAKTFVRGLNPALDQIGYVEYSAVSTITEELYCMEQTGRCADLEDVVASIESTFAVSETGDGTNIAAALWDGIWALMPGQEPDPDPSGQGLPPKTPGRRHYGRSDLARILILMSDGQANRYPDLPPGYGNCYSDDLWPDQAGETTDERRAKECAVWFAHQARDQGVVVYTIGLGARADHELLNHIADLTGGEYYYVPAADELDEALESIESVTTADCPFSIQVTKRVTPETSVSVGERLTYTVRTTVSGRVRPSLWITDHLPTQAVFITATPGFALSDGSLVWSFPADLFTQPLTLTHIVVLSAAGPAGVLTNTAVAADALGLASASASAAVTVVASQAYLPIVYKGSN